MKRTHPILFPLSLLLLLPTVALACLWDMDTLQQERSRFPTVLELVTGKFLRHSPEFYQWRIKDRQAKLKTDPKNVALYDDLAVAYSKTGQHEKAVETILLKEEIQPGLYETYSNLGTFYVLNGEFEKGLPYIDKALAINPDAHFGREKYQKWLVEYALQRSVEGKLHFPLQAKRQDEAEQTAGNFYDFLAQKLNPAAPRAFEPGAAPPTSGGVPVPAVEMTPSQLKEAIQGVLGMMRFADHENPLLLEALGDLLTGPFANDENAQQLAARCYVKAGMGMTDATANEAYRDLAVECLRMQTLRGKSPPLAATSAEPANRKVLTIQKQLKEELAEAKDWYVKLRAKELGLLRRSKDPDAEFNQLYQEEPAVSESSQKVGAAPEEPALGSYATVAIGSGLGFTALAAIGLYWHRKRRTNLAA